MNFDTLRYVVVEGPIGVGKTSLTHRLAERLGGQTLMERPQDNPFLEKFYRDAARHALPAQMFFLFQRLHQLRELAQGDLFEARVVSDFLLDKDPIFAELTLDDDELNLYRQLYNHLRPQAPAPDLVLYLQAEPATLLERIERRGIPMETAISAHYLHRLCESYSRFFHHYDAAPILIVNNEHWNPLQRDEDFELLIERIGAMRGRREYFNRGE
ncbi:MAG: deoxynucleoside kinase [Burkholderiaceae bacterium]